LHPSILQANSSPSITQWTTFRAIGGRATTSKTKMTKTKKLNVRIKILDEGYPLDDEGIA
jgi:hypothetical protein